MTYISFDTKPGTKIVYANKNCGYDYDQESAAKYLKLGRQYTLKSMSVGQSSSSLTLEEFPNVSFNLIMFDDVKRTYVIENHERGESFEVEASSEDDALYKAWEKLDYSISVKKN